MFQNAAGQVYAWFLDGSGATVDSGTGAGLKGSGYLSAVDLGDWKVVGVGDVNGDGIPDLIFQNGSGQVYAWFLDGTGTAVDFATGAGLKGFGYLSAAELGDWKVVGVGDVNGDGIPDIILQNGAGQVYAWFLDGSGATLDPGTGAGLKGFGYLSAVGLGDWKVVGVGDVNGDGIPDVILQNGAGQVYAWFLDGSGATLDPGTGAGLKGFGYLSAVGLVDWKVVGIGDVNGDGIPDIILQNGAGQVYAWFLDGSGAALDFGTKAGLKGFGFLYDRRLDWLADALTSPLVFAPIPKISGTIRRVAMRRSTE